MAFPKKEIKPRTCIYIGMKHEPSFIKGTWLEAEEFCYPGGGMKRKCKATCEDGVQRIITCGIPDTMFSIPGYRRKDGERVRGFVSSGEEGFKFTEYPCKAKRKKPTPSAAK